MHWEETYFYVALGITKLKPTNVKISVLNSKINKHL